MDRRDRAQPHKRRVTCAHPHCLDSGQWLEPFTLGPFLGHDNHRGRSVVDSAGVPRCNGAGLRNESRGKLSQGLHGEARPEMLVLVKDLWFAFPLWHCYGDYLFRKRLVGGGPFHIVMAAKSYLILFLASNP